MALLTRTHIVLVTLAIAPVAAAQPADQPDPNQPAQPAAPTADQAPAPDTSTAPAVEEPPAPPNGDSNEENSHDDDSGGGKKHKKKKKKGDEYVPGQGISMRAGKARLKFFLGAETVFLEGHCVGDACPSAADSLTIHVRRARFATEVHLPHHLRIDFGVQVKNEILVLKNANFSWHHHGDSIKFGFLKPPGGIERDSSTWIKAFPERSVVANFKQDRLIGVMGTKWLADHTFRLQGAAGHPPTGNFDAFEPEDVVLPPPGIEPEDLTSDPANGDLFATATYAPSDNFSVGVNTTAHIAPDAGQGVNFSEPYETRVVQPVFFKGAFFGAGADISWHNDHVRASAEGVVFHQGDTIPHTDDGTATGNPIEPTRGKRGEAGYVVLGYTPCGHYGAALENSPLLDRYQFLLRFEGLVVSPGGDGKANSTARFGSVTGGVEWQLYKQLRLQADVAVQKYNQSADPSNKDVWRIYTELWGQVRM